MNENVIVRFKYGPVLEIQQSVGAVPHEGDSIEIRKELFKVIIPPTYNLTTGEIIIHLTKVE